MNDSNGRVRGDGNLNRGMKKKKEKENDAEKKKKRIGEKRKGGEGGKSGEK